MNKIKPEQIATLNTLFRAIYQQLQSHQIDPPKDVTCIELDILEIVDAQPETILKEIGDQLHIPGSTLTSAIDRLENRQLLKRTISKRDRRSYGLELTPEGRSVLEEHQQAKITTWEKVLAALDYESEREQFLVLIKKIADKLD